MPRLEAPDRVLLGYLAAITLVVAAFHDRVVVAGVLLLDHVLAASLLLLLLVVEDRRPSRFWRIARDWYPCILVPMAFRELHYLVYPIHPFDGDSLLRALDRRLFGFDPTVALQAWTTPALTELLQVVYSSYFFMPVGLALLVYTRRDRATFREVLSALLIAFFLSYAGYFLIPALGPRLAMKELHELKLSGLWLFPLLREGLDGLELEMWDCFPSAHTEVALVVLVYGWRHCRVYFWGLLPVVVLLIASTVYLRYHYVVDVLAGAALAAAIPFVNGWVLGARRVPGRSQAPAHARAGARAEEAQRKLLT
ncbi:MAG: phosphatase PAP2 family protein [Planctomycetes bacterium]|nr:phosphatase PAP2 family protein [Planctomycetota bacterium]